MKNEVFLYLVKHNVTPCLSLGISLPSRHIALYVEENVTRSIYLEALENYGNENTCN